MNLLQSPPKNEEVLYAQLKVDPWDLEKKFSE